MNGYILPEHNVIARGIMLTEQNSFQMNMRYDTAAMLMWFKADAVKELKKSKG